MRCPVCKADNPTEPLCRRCKADLGTLHDLEASRARAVAEARTAIEAGSWEAAFRAGLRADQLRRDPETCRVLALACLMLGRMNEARLWCARWQSVQG